MKKISMIPIDYSKLKYQEVTTSLDMVVSNIEISIMPIPNSVQAFITILENKNILVVNKIITMNEYVLRDFVYSQKINGDFMFITRNLDNINFNITLLGEKIILVYVGD